VGFIRRKSRYLSPAGAEVVYSLSSILAGKGKLAGIYDIGKTAGLATAWGYCGKGKEVKVGENSSGRGTGKEAKTGSKRRKTEWWAASFVTKSSEGERGREAQQGKCVVVASQARSQPRIFRETTAETSKGHRLMLSQVTGDTGAEKIAERDRE